MARQMAAPTHEEATMLTRLDHVVIAVRDLDAAMSRYTSLGFAVTRGGRHPGHGTENALIRFGLDYLELLTVANADEAHASGLNGRGVLAFLDAHPGGLLGFALASDDLAHDAARLRASDVEVEGPFAMSRERPDGTVLRWHLASPGGTPWRRPWPFLIQWEMPDDERLRLERPAAQPNGIRGVAGITLAVRDLDAAVALYERGLGLPLIGRRDRAELSAAEARFAVGGTRIELLAPRGDGPVAQALDAAGEGPLALHLRSDDLDATRRTVQLAGVTVDPSHDDAALTVPPEAALGARLVIVGEGT
jgi:catechol 2,3-dioxygenase-like lactoylglutathione lyase family enzyme